MRQLAGHQGELSVEQGFGVVLVGLAELVTDDVEEIQTLDLELFR